MYFQGIKCINQLAIFTTECILSRFLFTVGVKVPRKALILCRPASEHWPLGARIWIS